MWVWRRGLLQVQAGCKNRTLHSNSSRLVSVEDPGFFGLFNQQQQQQRSDPQKPPPSPLEDDDDQELREHLRIAFRGKIKEWARATQPEFMFRPSSSQPRPARRWPTTTHEKDREKKRKDDKDDDIDDDDLEEEEEEEDDDDDDEKNEDQEGASDIDEDDDVDELDVVDDEDELDKLDDDSDYEDDYGLNGDNADREEIRTHKKQHHERDAFEHKGNAPLVLEPPPGRADEELYYFSRRGKLKYKHPQIIASKEDIYKELSESGLISSKLKRPLPVLKLVKKTDAEIVGWYYYCSIEMLQFFRICHNLKEVKAIVEYHIRWSAIRTLAKKHGCNPRHIVKKYGRDLECEDKKGKKVRLMTRQEIKEVARGVNKRVQMCHRFGALRVLAEMD